jgi:hypothetical protein
MENHLYDPIRKDWVPATPEEYVRQHLLDSLINALGFPQELIMVEKGLAQMPHLSLQGAGRIPARRADIVCFAKNIHPDSSLHPLLLIECKAVPITSGVMRQILGYNHYMNAFFFAAVNQSEIRLGCFDRSSGKYAYIPKLLPYQELVRKISSSFISS